LYLLQEVLRAACRLHVQVLGQLEINHRAHRARKAVFLGDLGGLGGDPHLTR
jgi:hypothetical protein